MTFFESRGLQGPWTPLLHPPLSWLIHLYFKSYQLVFFYIKQMYISYSKKR